MYLNFQRKKLFIVPYIQNVADIIRSPAITTWGFLIATEKLFGKNTVALWKQE